MNAHTRLPSDVAARKSIPIATGCVDYFPDALTEIAALSKIGNDQHNPGQPLHWDRSKSTDEADALMRHFVQRGGFDTDGVRHSAKVAWRACALLQKEIEAARDLSVPSDRLSATNEWAKTPQQQADVALAEHQAQRERSVSDGVAIFPFPSGDGCAIASVMQRPDETYPEALLRTREENMRHGFVLGETVNTKKSKRGHLPGRVTGFGDHTDILVEWQTRVDDGYPVAGYYPADDLRHGP